MAQDDILDDANLRSLSNRKLIRHLAFSAFGGFAFAVAVSSVLYMCVTNVLFSWTYAVCVVFVGIVLALRAKMHKSTEATRLMMSVALFGALLTAGSAVASVVIAHAQKSPPLLLIALYSLSGIGCAYPVAFITTDLYNRVVRHGSEVSAKQLYTLATAAIIVGCCCGFFFTVVDVEQHVARFGYEQWISAAVAAVGGACVGYVNFFARDESLKVEFDPLPMDDFDTPRDPADS